eukprot:CAMPEP_0117647768 /NCGR_PEP_ID=MMETSP0804-20121206/21_1 /TAXON_ID=1074897 /ORGANISM="Tetraselmis astigmatica, Strain CCMP880" /LENGTH=60 /DNA_ID=CAMNT_0005453273 /DNA_START=775 /DNA_END=957 /DNA_ORIENTATION=-
MPSHPMMYANLEGSLAATWKVAARGKTGNKNTTMKRSKQAIYKEWILMPEGGGRQGASVP